ncbi:P2X purinoceptor 3a isoform X2 [Puntigrus tetrazona]|uniref:P2X purinoceptor 3a isoform X2 n=1 Tax=Puntigrus tetrazona TaxID=1606681 RepID=UPI001C89A810|nr:P2X purinoceptor 3a isoform X2 [Puntigrus tetrazona]
MAHRILHFITDFFVYETAKSVVVKSWSVGIINRVVQLLIILYFICWVFMHEKGHQLRDTGIESAVMTKVKGLGRFDKRVMDVADYVIPSQGGSSFSVITSMVITPNQTQGLCTETDVKLRFNCTGDDDCMAKMGSNLGNGIITGKCLNNDKNTTGWCEIEGWCPAEDDNNLAPSVTGVENFTIFIKNSIRFPLFNVTRGNFPSNLNKDKIRGCHYDPVQNPFCPIFKVGDILRHINQSLDSITKKAGKFNTVPFLINLVAAFTSVGLATVFCDIILLNFLKGAEEYKAKKFEEVTDVVYKSANNRLNEGSQMSLKAMEKRSNDSGTFSIGRQESHS